MNILLVEDNDIKYRVVQRWLAERFPYINLTRAGSYQSGVRSAIKLRPDWILLDMTLPVFDEQNGILTRNHLHFGGELLLREIKRKGVRSKVIIVTQYRSFVREEGVVSFEQLKGELLASYSEIVVDCIFLETSSMAWRSEIEKYLANNENSDS